MVDIQIKNMVCDRCISTVNRIFKQNGLPVQSVELGKVTLAEAIEKSTLNSLKSDLEQEGFAIINAQVPILVNQIKTTLLLFFQNLPVPEDFKLSTYLQGELPYDYAHLSRVFSQYSDDTLEHYLIKLRVEKAKEMLSYKERNVSEIAFDLGYTSVAHFSRQFKKYTGSSPSKFRSQPSERNSLSDI